MRLPVKFRRGRAGPGCALALSFCLLISPPLCRGAELQLFSASQQAMGTIFNLYLYAENANAATAYLDVAFEEIHRLDETLSNYQPTSELSRINRLAATEAVTTDPEVFGFLQHALEYSRNSDGAFDITVGPLLRAWGFFRGQGHYPTSQELEQARAAVGWRHVVLNPGLRTVRFNIAGVELDPGGIGKGYAVERVADLLRDAGIKAALIDAGSSTIYGLGAPPGKEGWRVRVPRPGHEEQTLSTVLLRDTALSTSGKFGKFFRLNGRMYCHIMDPRTGAPVAETLQTSVVTPGGTDSDVLSTATFVLGPERGKQLIDRIAGTKALWVLGNSPDNLRTVSWHWQEAPAGTAPLTLSHQAKQNPHATQAAKSRYEP